MRFKGTFGLLMVFAVLGGYVYFAEFRGKEQKQHQEEAKKKLFQVEDKDIVEITLAYPGQTFAASRKPDKLWEMTNPQGVEADSEEWDRLASEIVRMEREDTVAADKPDLSQYGLDKPAITVTAKLVNGQSLGVLLGGQNPKKTSSYAKLSDKPDVFLTATSTSFQKSLGDLRNKKVLDFEPDNVDSLRIVDGASETQFQKSGMDWLLKKPLAAKADNAEVTTFLSTVHFARATEFADPSVDEKAAGLDPVSTKIVVHDAKAGADRVLLIGKLQGVDKYFAKDAARPTIFVLDKQVPEKIRRPIFDWRDKSIAQLDSEAIDEIQLVRGSEKVSMKKMGTEWTLADGRRLQESKISGMLNALEFEHATQLIDFPKPLLTYGLDKPRLEAVFRKAGKDVFGVKFGADSRNPEGIYLKSSLADTVFTVSKDVFGKFSTKVDDLVEVQPKPKQ